MEAAVLSGEAARQQIPGALRAAADLGGDQLHLPPHALRWDARKLGGRHAAGIPVRLEGAHAHQENRRKAGAHNVEFLKGEIENIPLPDNTVDVIISNCVINLSADKDRVFREALRVLKPGGRFAVSDVVTRGEMLPQIRQSVLAWVGCIAGALEENDYRN